MKYHPIDQAQAEILGQEKAIHTAQLVLATDGLGVLIINNKMQLHTARGVERTFRNPLAAFTVLKKLGVQTASVDLSAWPGTTKELSNE